MLPGVSVDEHVDDTTGPIAWDVPAHDHVLEDERSGDISDEIVRVAREVAALERLVDHRVDGFQNSVDERFGGVGNSR